MRRSHQAIPTTKIEEKKKRDAIIHSIAIEQTVLESKEKEVADIEEQIEELELEAGRIAIENEQAATELAALQQDLPKLRLQKEVLEGDVSLLKDTVNELLSEAALSKQEIKLLSERVSKEQSEYSAKIEGLKDLERKIVVDLNRTGTELQEKISELRNAESALIVSIESLKKEKENLDFGIASRMTELAQINKNVAETSFQRERAERQLREVDEKLNAITISLIDKDNEVASKNAEIAEKEAQVEARRQELVGIVVRENNLASKTAAMRDLFQKAGLKVDF